MFVLLLFRIRTSANHYNSELTSEIIDVIGIRARCDRPANNVFSFAYSN
jgi:hypothetical protein